MKRVMIIGISGAGKSTLCRNLAAKLHVPFYHLDNIYHAPGWVARAPEDVQKDFESIAGQEAWVVDGNYRRLTEKLRTRADVIVFLEFNRFFGIYRILKRWALHNLQLQKRPDLGEGFDEKMSWAFLKWVWDWPKDTGANWREELKKYPEKLVVLKSRQEINRWLKEIV